MMSFAILTEVIPHLHAATAGQYHPRFYLDKDEVECGNNATVTHGGPHSKNAENGSILSGGTVYSLVSSPSTGTD